MSHDPLPALAELERRYDGPIPEPLLRAAGLGSAALAELLLAEGQARFFKGMAQGQIAIIRRRRKEGSLYPGLVADLVFYRQRWRDWRRRVRALSRAFEGEAAPAATRPAAE